MEKLTKRSDGIAETPSGDFAVFMTRSYQLTSDDVRFFSYRPSIVGDPVRIEWVGDIAVIPPLYALSLIKSGHGRNPTDDEVDYYNLELDEKTPSKSAEKSDEKKKLVDAPVAEKADEKPSDESKLPVDAGDDGDEKSRSRSTKVKETDNE